MLALGAVLTGCAPAGGPGAGATTSPTTAAATDLPACGKPPSPAADPPPPGAVLPPGTVLTAVRDEGDVTQLNAYVEQSPSDVLAWVSGQRDLGMLSVAEASTQVEILVAAAGWHTFMRARAVCAGGSQLSEVIAVEGSGAVLPTPSVR